MKGLMTMSGRTTFHQNHLPNFLLRERGSSTVELALVFPILLLLFVGTAELGRLFYTYTTLAKATKVGARYLSVQRDAVSADATKRAAVKLAAQRLVVCGKTTTCAGSTPIVAGLDVNNPANSVNVTMPSSTAVTKYVDVQIQGYTFAPGVFNIAAMTGGTAFYIPLTPKIEMRYMP